MHPPFFSVDHKIGPDIHHAGDDRPVVRRGVPTRLVLQPATTGWPPVPFLPQEDGQLPTGAQAMLRPHLQLVPPPQATWRNILGRWMIRTGQRLILQNRPG